VSPSLPVHFQAEVEHSGEAIVTQNGVQRSEESPSTLNNLSISLNKRCISRILLLNNTAIVTQNGEQRSEASPSP